MSKGIKKISENVVVDGRAFTLTNGSITDNGVFPVGTLRCNPTTKGLEFKSGTNMFSKFDAASLLADGSIIERLIATNAVTTNKIKDLNITTAKLADKSVTTPKLADSAVTTIKIGDSQVTEIKLAPSSVTTTKVKDRNITSTKIGLKQVLDEHIGDAQVTNRALSNYSVTDIKLATDSVVTNKIKNRNVTTEKLAIGSVHGSIIPDSGIVTNHLQDSSVTTVKLANGAVTTIKIGDKQVTEPKLADASVSTRIIINKSVTNAKLADNSVGTINIQDNSVTINKLSPELKNDLDRVVKYDDSNNVNLKNNLTVNGKIKANGDIEGARVLNAVYMDLAEAYIPGEELEPGDIVEMRYDGKVYKAYKEHMLNSTIVGVVSDEYASCYGATQEELESGAKVAVGLIGKVHVKVMGPCNIGMKVSAHHDGAGKASYCEPSSRIIGKCLEQSTETGINKVLCLIYPN